MKAKKLVALMIIMVLVVCSNVNAYAGVFGGRWASNPTYYIDASNAYYSEFNNAISSWNSALSSIGASISFYYATLISSSVVTITDYYGYVGWNAQGEPGPNIYSGTYTYGTVRLNRTFMDNFSTGKRKAIITHELGHILGLSHNSYTTTQTLMYEGGSEVYYDQWGISSPTNTEIGFLNTIY